MIFDHMMYDFLMFSRQWIITKGGFMDIMGDLAYDYWDWMVRLCFRIFIVSIFFVTSGISSSFSKSNLMRGIRLLLVALLLTVITHIGKQLGMINFTIDIGVLHCLAISILLYELFRKLKINLFIIAAIGCIIIIGGFFIYYFGMYAETDNLSLFGLATKQFWYSQGDYFPLLPWSGLLLFGGALGQLFYSKRNSLLPCADRAWNRPFCFIGRHALILYFAHQVLIFGAFYVTGVILGLN